MDDATPICATPARNGPHKGKPATGTTAGYYRHYRAKEPPCEPCRLANCENSRRLRAENPQYLERARELRQMNPEPRRLANRKWQAANRDKVRAKQARWRANNLERARELDRLSARRWAENNQELLAERRREYQKRNRAMRREQVAEWQRRRRARIAGGINIDFTAEQFDQRMSMFGHACWMCGGDYEHTDHVIAIARGGPHCLANLRPACARCNQVKSGKDWRLFVSQREVA